MSLPILLGISGASGVIYGVETLKVLAEMGQPCHLILSEAGARNLAIETEHELEQVKEMATEVYEVDDLAAPPASGSFRHRGMLVAPCTIKTLSAIANSFNHNLLIRAADVCLKERRPLVLVVRETPLHQGHLELMSKAAGLGASILPPVPAFYHQPQSIRDLIHQSIGKALDLLGVEHQLFRRWGG